ncbi:altronate dehydratase [Salipaludibacillus agaradhaerens]|uniref:Altronate dehydratase n=1 Tax=Salipaludibacillus agaradhaerens TaxID=76935 RepID=A0A9Q4AZ56_SALAG|nr:altronate dehydratase family protein [Salipaludibacillus agaradhaerens]MCR6095339.1 altronate dehydratase [Salipaludibacillus agaradhaerens]MCR6115103.1 altronate dehydratase [Salipaludibacillus agaradhaerens]
MKEHYLQVHKSDNVIVALREFKEGETIDLSTGPLKVTETIRTGHKIAVTKIEKNHNVTKYGYPIGSAKEDILPGEWVHTHNVKTNLEGTLSYEYDPKKSPLNVDRNSGRTFRGYRRKNGEVGIRNEIWIINTVGCINKTAEIVAKTANDMYRDERLDGIYHYPHLFGCSQLGDDLHNTQKILRNLVMHPNAAAILVMGLGCENNHIAEFKKVLGDYDEERVKFIAVQESGDEISEALDLVEGLVGYAKTFEREDISVSELKVGLKCGGSDGFSGITGNPLLGAFSDKLITHGGTTVLTEVPEMFGAEKILMERAKDEVVFNKIVDLINDFKDYFLKHGQNVYENPSPGNKEGGITTLEEKSLGNVQKGGFAEVTDVLPYGERLSQKGLTLLQGPGNDLVSVTALAASGAHIVIFTTGRGTPFGGPVPTIKVSTNTALAEKKEKWIDFDAGQMISGKNKQELTDKFFDYMLDIASGTVKARNEQFGFKEISIFKDGVIL